MCEALTRRRVLAACSAVATAGCLGGGDPPPGLRQIEITNYMYTDVAVDVTVRKREQTVFDETLHLSGEQGERVIQMRHDWMGDRAYYEAIFEASIDGRQLESSVDSFTLIGKKRDYGEISCFTPHVGIEPEEITIALGFSEACDPPTTEAPTRRVSRS